MAGVRRVRAKQKKKETDTITCTLERDSTTQAKNCGRRRQRCKTKNEIIHRAFEWFVACAFYFFAILLRLRGKGYNLTFSPFKLIFIASKKHVCPRQAQPRNCRASKGNKNTSSKLWLQQLMRNLCRMSTADDNEQSMSRTA